MTERTESPTDQVADQAAVALDDVQAVAQYRSVSGLAVLAAVLGVVSVVAVFSTALLFLPVVGAVVAVLALRRINASEGQLAGRGAALVGLVLALAIGSGVFVRAWVVERLVVQQAQQWALGWCDLVRQGELVTALELKQSPARRRVFDESLTEYYELNDAARETLDQFRQDPVIQMLQNAPDDARVVPGDVAQLAQDSAGNYIVLHSFELQVPGATGPAASQVFRLQLRKVRYTRAGDSAWMLSEHVMGLE